MTKKDWKAKAKNPPTGKEGPGAILMGLDKGKNETDTTKEAKRIDKIEAENTNTTTKDNDKNHTSMDASIDTSANKSTETTKVTFVREKIKIKKDKLKYTDTHTSVSTYIRNDLLDRLNRIAPYVDGGKAGIINRALEDHLQLYEEEE